MTNERLKSRILRGLSCLYLVSLCLIGQTACSGGPVATAGNPPPPQPTNSKSAKRPTLSPQATNEDYAEDPEQISGAFLVCGGDVLADTYGAADEDAPYGCAVLDQNHQKQAGCSAPKTIDVAYIGGSGGSTLKTRPADKNSSWLFHFSAPFDEKLASVQADIDCLGSTDPYNAVGPQVDYAMPLVNEVMAGKAQLLFVTKSTSNGNLGGRSRADTKCNEEGKNPALSSGSANSISFVALLSDGTKHAKDLIQANKPILNSRWQLVAKPEKLLPPPNEYPASYSLLAPILDAKGERASGKVWTGSTPYGTIAVAPQGGPKVPGTCDNWSDTGYYQGAVGEASEQNGQWIFDGPVQPCSTSLRLYCVSQ